MTKGLGFGGPVANNTGDDLIGLGIQQWFSPRWLPLNTTQKAFKASRNTIRSTSHPQSQALARVNSSTTSNSIGSRSSELQTEPRRGQHQQWHQQQAALLPTETTGYQTLSHPSVAAHSSFARPLCFWDQPRPVPEATSPTRLNARTRTAQAGVSSKSSAPRFSTAAHQQHKQHEQHKQHKQHHAGQPTEVSSRYWTSEPFVGLYAATPTVQQQYQQPYQHQKILHALAHSQAPQHFDSESSRSSSKRRVVNDSFLGLHQPLQQQQLVGKEGAVSSIIVPSKSCNNNTPSLLQQQLESIPAVINNPVTLTTTPAATTTYLGSLTAAHTAAHTATNPIVFSSSSSSHGQGLHSSHSSPAQSLSSFWSSLPGCSTTNSHCITNGAVFCPILCPIPHGFPTHSPAVAGSSLPLSLQYSVPGMAAPFGDDNDELARMQELSNSWEPEATGPLISECLPSSALTKEYANADPIYQIKTASLPQKYAQYRTCRGDGHCGWRAIAFSYFENLLRMGNKQKFASEEQRLKSLATLLKDTGLPEHVYEDFLDDTLELLQETGNSTDGGAGLLQVFNDFGRSMSIITYFKTLTGAWLRTHADDYQPYLEVPLEEYCKTRIDPAVAEIDHVGLTALLDLLIKPAGIGAEVLYLDRNVGEDVTSYQYEPLDQNGQVIHNHPWFRLLYRPGHYDILYKLEDLPAPVPTGPPPPVPQNLFVAFSHGQSSQLGNPAPLPFVATNFEIPGMGFFPGQQTSQKSWDPLSAAFGYQSTPVPVQSPPPVNTQPRALPIRTSDFTHVRTANTMPEYYGDSNPPSSHVMTPTSPISPSYGPPLIDSSRFRPSKFEYERDYIAMSSSSSQIYQTPIFKNSHFNVAHFNNPEFTPEQWKPEFEYRNGNEKRKRPSQ